MDQPAQEIVRLEKMLDAFAKYEELREKRSASRAKTRARKDIPPITQTETP